MSYERALGHPLRARLLSELAEREASPAELARDLNESLGVVAYHVRALVSAGLLDLVRRTFIRGAVQHHYRAREVGLLTRHIVVPPDHADALVSKMRELLDEASQSAPVDGTGVPLTAYVRRGDA